MDAELVALWYWVLAALDAGPLPLAASFLAEVFILSVEWLEYANAPTNKKSAEARHVTG